MKIAFIFGTRPEAIKLAPIILAMRNHPVMQGIVCVTGQHREMLDQMMNVFGITADADLGLMQPNQTLSGLTARAIEALDGFLQEVKPDFIFVQGDTTTAFCAALVAFYHHIPVGHVEAGLRTYNYEAPWPEEANRVLLSRLASLHFTPTEISRENLLKEGIADKTITITGNTVIDALFLALKMVKQKLPRIPDLPDFLQPSAGSQNNNPRMILITGHRRESFGKGFENICQAIAELAMRFSDVHFVYPVHLNPNVQVPVRRILGFGEGGSKERRNGEGQYDQTPLWNVHLIEPLAYLEFIGMMERSTLLLTDSGGVQEEAPSLGKPVLVMRETTERPEGVAAGTARLVGTDKERIVSEVSRLLNDQEFYLSMSQRRNPYGDGLASERIIQVVCDYLK